MYKLATLLVVAALESTAQIPMSGTDRGMLYYRRRGGRRQ